MSPKSFSVRIFLQDGHAGGVKVIAKSKWSGRALVIPRTSLDTEINRTELNSPGLFILVGPSAKDSLPTIYIGSADPVCGELQRHRDQESFWEWTIVFAAKDDSLEQAQFEYIKSRLLQLAREFKRANLTNSCTSAFTEIPSADLSVTDTFLEHIISLCPVLGLPFFEKIEPDKLTGRTTEEDS